MSEPPGSLFDRIPANLPEELTTELLVRRGLRVERIVSRGHASPEGYWYDQPEDEWILLIAGSAIIGYDGPAREVALAPGDYLLIPAHERHRVVSTHPEQETIWLAIFTAAVGAPSG